MCVCVCVRERERETGDCVGLYGLTICMYLQVHVHVGTYCIYTHIHSVCMCVYMYAVCVHTSYVKDVRR